MSSYQLKAVLTAVDKISPSLKGINKSVSILRKSFRDISNAGSQITRQLGLPAILSFSAIAYGAVRATKSTMEYASSIQDAADRTGAGVEEYQVLSNLLGLVGGSAEDAEMAFTKFNKGVAEGAAGADKNFAGLMKKLGIPLKNTKGQLIGLAEALPDLAKGFAKNKNPTTQTRMATELWGKSGSKMIPVVNGLADGTMSLSEAMKKIVDKKSITDLDDLGDSITNLGTQTRNVLTTSLAKMVPVMKPIIESIGAWVSANKELIQNSIVSVLTEVAKILKEINWKETFKDIKSIIGDIKDFVTAIGGVKTVLYGLGLLFIAGPVASIFAIAGAVWRMGSAFASLIGPVSDSGGVIAKIFGNGAASKITSNLSSIAKNAGLLGAAALVGWGIGTAISDALGESTKDKIGETIARALAFFGNEEAKAALHANGIGSSPKIDQKNSFQNPTGLFTTNKQYGDLVRNRSNLVGNNQTKLNGEMTVKFENVPPGTRVDVGKTNQSGVFMNADVGYRRLIAGY